MTGVEYQQLAQRTSNTNLSSSKIENALFGLAGEVGELHDHYKKYVFQGHSFDRAHMIREAGDVAWYLAELAAGLGWAVRWMRFSRRTLRSWKNGIRERCLTLRSR